MRPRIRWTGQGAAYAIVSGASLVAGALAASLPLVALGGLLGGVLVLDAVLALSRKPTIGLSASPLRVEEGRPIEIRLEGRGLNRSHHLRVHLPAAFELEAGSNVWIPEQGQDTHAFEARARVRGPQEVGPLSLRNWSPSRLWALESHVQEAETVEVVPRRQDVADVLLASRTLRPMQGRFQINRPAHGFDFFALREYQSSDTMRSVNWKATARRDELIVNQRQMETQTEMLILLDARVVAGAGPMGRTPLDRGCRLALGLFADAVSNRDTVHFLAYGDGLDEMPPIREDRVVVMENMLSRLRADGKTGARAAWDQAKRDLRSAGPVIIITSAEADPSLPDAVQDMLAREHPTMILSPEPTDDLAPDLREGRRLSRFAALDHLRNMGATAVDWKDAEHLEVPRPTIPGVAH